MDSVLKLAAVFALVAINGIFVAAEFALVGARPTRIDQLVAQGNRRARSSNTQWMTPTGSSLLRRLVSPWPVWGWVGWRNQRSLNC